MPACLVFVQSGFPFRTICQAFPGPSYLIRGRQCRLVEAPFLVQHDWRSHDILAGAQDVHRPFDPSRFRFAADGGDFAAVCGRLLDVFHHAVFPLPCLSFSTFMLVTRDLAFLGAIQEALVRGGTRVEEAYPDPGTRSGDFRNACFTDYHAQGCLALRVAEDEGVPPLLVSCLPASSEDDDPEEDPDAPPAPRIPWYAEDLALQDTVLAIPLPRGRAGERLVISRVREVAACARIWARGDAGIADMLLAGDADPEAVRRLVSDDPVWYFSGGQRGDVARWVYSLHQCGGQGEYHAHFRARDPRLTDRLWSWILEDPARHGFLPMARF